MSGGNVDGFCLEGNERNAKFWFGLVRAWKDDEGNELFQAREIFPSLDVIPSIRTDDPEKFCARIFFTKIFGGDVGVRFFLFAVEFKCGNFKFFLGGAFE